MLPFKLIRGSIKLKNILNTLKVQINAGGAHVWFTTTLPQSSFSWKICWTNIMHCLLYLLHLQPLFLTECQASLAHPQTLANFRQNGFLSTRYNTHQKSTKSRTASNCQDTFSSQHPCKEAQEPISTQWGNYLESPFVQTQDSSS